MNIVLCPCVNNTYQIRTETHQGKKHLVVPVVMMVEGVHHGSAGPLFHPITELGKFPGAWDGIPVTIQHPENEGTPISANSPEVIDRIVVGRVYHTHVDGAKLRAEVYVDYDRIRQVSPVAFSYLVSQRPLEVSVGVFTDDDGAEGDWNGEHYYAIARNHRPDHLALLPGGTGACSWQDGCGIRANKEGGFEVKINKEVVNLVIAEGFIPVAMSVDYRDVIRKIQSKLDALDTDSKIHFIEGVFDDGTFVYSIRGEGRSEQLFKRDYTVNEDGSVEFGESMQEVQRQVEYINVNQKDNEDKMRRTKINSSKGGITIMKEQVDALLAIAGAIYSEADRPWLETLAENQISKLMACAQSKVREVQVPAPAVNTEQQAIQVLEGKLSNFDEFKKLIPAPIREQLEHGQQLYEKHRTDLIQHITANQATESWTADDLKSMPTSMLNKLASSIKPKVDYSAQGGGIPPANHSEQIMLPSGLQAK